MGATVLRARVFLSIITCGIFGFFLFYQLMRRDRDHNRRRLELLDAANALAWEQASDPARVKGKHNYIGRVIATIATCGIYHLWWFYNMQVEGNHHLQSNWVFDDALANASLG